MNPRPEKAPRAPESREHAIFDVQFEAARAFLAGLARSGFCVLALALGCRPLGANDFFVAPNGTPAGPGALASPFDLLTPLSGKAGQPGDTFWLREGLYKLGHLDTTLRGAPGLPITFRELTGEHARVDGSITVFDSPGYVVFRDFELFSSDTNRISTQTNAGFNPTDITNTTAIGAYSPNLSFINLVVHDATRTGIFFPDTSSNTLVYGCLLYNNGWVSPDNAEGHGIYAQSRRGPSTLADNIVFNNAGVGFHVYQNSPGEDLSDITLEGNVAFNAGAIQHVRESRDWIIGVDAPATFADNMVLRSNLGFAGKNLARAPQMQIGRDGANGSVVLQDNYMPLGLSLHNWSNAIVTGNFFAPKAAGYVIDLNQTLTSLAATWNNNTYVCDPAGAQVLYGLVPTSFAGWRALSGFDSNSTFVLGRPHGARVFVRPNRYEPGRANLIVYNWDNLDTVDVDVRSVLQPNAAFAVWNAQDPLAGPVLRGVFHGQPLQLPMTNLTVALPNVPLNAPLAAAPPTGPTFNAFVLRSLPPALSIAPVNGAFQISWPVSAGAGALQCSSNLDPGATWAASTDSPVVMADQFVITNAIADAAKFYRLRPN